MSRSLSKGPYVDERLLARVREMQQTGKKRVIRTWARRSVITPEFVGLTMGVHNGKQFIPVFISENMVGHSLGEFSPTRTFRIHSGLRKAETPQTT